jgi:Spirocyclase AveC-like
VWAALGAASVVLMVVVLTQWLAAGVTTLPPGADRLSGIRPALIQVLQWGSLLALTGLLWTQVAGPLLRRQPLSFDGLLVLGFLSLNFWDPLDNYWSFAFQYNAHFVNIGTWGAFIPGWHSAHGGDWAVPLAFVFGTYLWGFVIGARLAGATAARARSRGWGTAPAWAVAFVACAAFEAACELVFLRTGAIANIRTARALTLWPGTTHQWPLYNPFLFAAVWTAIGALRTSALTNDATFLDRGLDRLAPAGPRRTIVRFLALSAFLQVLYIGLYFIPWNLFAQLPAAVPHLPSYFPR